MNSLDKQDDKGIFALFKGKPSTAKTVGALSFPDPEVMDFDVKLPAVAIKHFPKKSVEYHQFKNLEGVKNLIEGWIDGSKKCHETIIVDSVTTAAKFIITEVCEALGQSTFKQLTTITKSQKTGKDMIEAIDISVYNHELRFFYSMLTSLKLLWMRPGNPKNVIFIAHILANDYTNLKGEVIRERTIVTSGKKTGVYIPTEFDNEFMFTHKITGMPGDEKVNYVMSTVTNGEWTARSALKLSPKIDFTHPKNLYDEIQKELRGNELFSI